MFKDSFFKGLVNSLTNDRCRDVSEWAEKYRYLPSVGSSEAGKWHNKRVPYMKEIMSALSIHSDTKKVVFMKGTQLAGTEAILNFIGYVMHSQPETIISLLPTVGNCSRFSKMRVQPMIDCTPVLSEIVSNNRDQDSGNTILDKEFEGGRLLLNGSNSSSDARMTASGYLCADEIDEYKDDLNNQGDWLSIYNKRMSTYPNSKTFLVSTPTVKDFSRIEYEFLRGTQEYFHVPCPHCKFKQVVRWEAFLYDKEDVDSIRLKCISCKKKIEEEEKFYMLEHGEWVPSVDKPKEKDCRSFHLSSLYSPYGWKKWSECLEDYIDGLKSPIKMKTFVNTLLGETYEESAKEISHEIIMKRAEKYKAQVPKGVLVLVAGTDTQADRLEASVYGYGLGEECWHIEHRIFYGDPARKEVWEEMDLFLMQTFKGEDGHNFKIKCTCIDTAGGFEKQAYEFVKPREKYRIYGIKGSSQNGSPLVNRPVKKSKVKINLFTIGTATGKTTLYSYLNVTKAGACYIHFPKGLEEEFYQQLVAEKIRTKYRNGFPYQEWFKKRDRNETLDCWVYAYAALNILNPNYVAIHEGLYAEKVPKKDTEDSYKPIKKARTTGKFKRSK